MTQQQALDILKLGHNVFLTGEPGSGKTHTLNTFIDYLREHDVNVAVTASTGIAATHLNGMTIHSWSGIGVKDYMDDYQLDKLAKKSGMKGRFSNVRVLIIDEISMLAGKQLNMVNDICKRLKNSPKPFGGLQLVVSGDLFQLPPVTKRGEEVDYPFRSHAWAEARFKVCYLSEQHRQADDQQLLDVLREIRNQDVSDGTNQLLQGRLEYFTEDPDITRLFSHNADVDALNNARLKEIDSEPKTFTAETSGRKAYAEQLLATCIAPETLQLKRGAQILFTVNSPANGFFNGTRGEVVDFHLGKPVVALHNGKEIAVDRHTWKIEDGSDTLAELAQYPLRLAWAITVHKSQGMSLDEADIDLSRAFTPGMGYVALSRLKKLSGLYLRGANRMALAIDPVVAELDQQLSAQSQVNADSLVGIKNKHLEKLHGTVRSNLSQDYAEYDKILLKQLKKWRSAQAKKQKVPAYIVLGDKTIMALAAEKPNTVKQLGTITGIGPKKLEQYAEELLTTIAQHSGRIA